MKRGVFAIVHCAQLLCTSSRQVQCATRSEDATKMARCEADCAGPSPQYYAWYEVFPGAGVNFTNPVSPGDKFTGTVTSQGNDKFQLVLKDITQGWTQTINATAAGADLSSAEAIAEAPSGTSGT